MSLVLYTVTFFIFYTCVYEHLWQYVIQTDLVRLNSRAYLVSAYVGRRRTAPEVRIGLTIFCT